MILLLGHWDIYSLLFLTMAFFGCPCLIAGPLCFILACCASRSQERLVQRVQTRRRNRQDGTPTLREVIYQLGENSVCPVCLLEIENGQELPCGHRFHEECIKKQLRNDKCPFCIDNLRCERAYEVFKHDGVMESFRFDRNYEG